MDHLIDQQAVSPGEVALLHEAMYESAVAGYRRTFPSPRPFWHQFDRLAREHVAGMSIELQAQSDPRCFTAETFFTMACARIAPMLTVVAALADASEQPDLLPALEASVKPVIVAAQMYDDIGDWQEDLEAGRVTYYLTRLVPQHAWETADLHAAEDIRRAIDHGWVDVAHLRNVVGWFDEAIAVLGTRECRTWRDWVHQYRTAADQHLSMFVARHLARSLRPLIDIPDTTQGGAGRPH
jgi:hypothetical protein